MSCGLTLFTVFLIMLSVAVGAILSILYLAYIGRHVKKISDEYKANLECQKKHTK